MKKSFIKKVGIFGVFTVLCLCVGSAVFALTPGQKTLLTKRAATVDAYRNMAEMVNGLQISSSTYVRDFVAESDEIQAQLNSYIKGLRVVDTKFYDDGVCEVTVELVIQDLVKHLQTWEKRYPWGGQPYQFDKISYYYKQRVLKATGTGAPPER